ncbi:cation channel sperm-associated protein 1-like isoform X2 [Pieris napi]|uniref:cation channel sperm-associated protein 1-like isoform X2 n=1 Tax=Pieris napi TaxID=78633 RepID=UPI001FBB5ED3|nr:cation channel sperm-associated protein 1-like isoform X2 [Pieris napi]
MKYHIFLGLFAVAAAYPGLIHEEAPQLNHQALIGETGHHHQIQHEHAKSHQSIKFEHFHPVPVYVKKEHSHLLHHPLEKGQSESNLKQIHPETQQAHGYGLVLEDHRLNTDHLSANLGQGDYSAGLEHGGIQHGGFEHGGIQHGGLEHGSLSQGLQHGGYEQFAGGYESSEGLKAYAEAQPELGQYGGHIQVSGGSEENNGYGHYQ